MFATARRVILLLVLVMSEDGELTTRTDDMATGAVTSDQFTQLMSAINASKTRIGSEMQMGDRITRFQTEVRQAQDDVTATALKRARYDVLACSCLRYSAGSLHVRYGENTLTSKMKVKGAFATAYKPSSPHRSIHDRT